jgi:adenosylhomocysteine nucleosidase
MILLLAAEGEEAAALLRRLEEKSAVPGPFPAHRGLFAGKEAAVVETLVGKAAAAAATAWAIATFQPKAAFFAGVAGALNTELAQGDLLVAKDAVQWDVDLTPFGRAPGELATGERFVPADPALVRALVEATGAKTGRVASGDRFVADAGLARWIRETFAADAVEMEGAAALWTARRFKVPMALLRIVSDRAGEDSDLDFAAFLKAGSERMAETLLATLAQLK